MDTFIKLNQKRIGKYLGPGQDVVGQTKDGIGVVLSGGPAELLSGPSKGESVTEVKLNQFVKIRPVAPIPTNKYTLFVSYNPKLAELGTVSCPNYPESGDDVFLTLKAGKSFDLKDLEYIFKIYLVD